MKSIARFLAILSLILVPMLSHGIGPRAFAAEPYCLDTDLAEMLQVINDYRDANALEPLTPSITLGAAAVAHSEDMAAMDYFDPTGSDGSTSQDRMTDAGYPLDQATETSESIYWGTGEYASSDAALAWWSDDPDANASLLNPTFLAVGIGMAFDSVSGKTLWTLTLADYVDSTAEPCDDLATPQAADGQDQSDDTATGDDQSEVDESTTDDDQGGIDETTDSEDQGGIDESTTDDDQGEVDETTDSDDQGEAEEGTPSDEEGTDETTGGDDVIVGNGNDVTGDDSGTEPDPSDVISNIGLGPIIVILRCPDDFDPSANNYLACSPIPAPSAVLVDTATNASFAFDTAARHDETNNVYYWDELPVGTYQIYPAEPGTQLTMFQANGWTPPVVSVANTFDVPRLGQRYLLQVYVYGTEPAAIPPVEAKSDDADGDGISDTEETDTYLTDPATFDTDGDGFGDGEEVAADSDPLDPESTPETGSPDTDDPDASRPDSDEDGLYDDDEVDVYFTDPANPDTDGDGSSDGQEVYDGSDPLDPESFGP